MHGSSVGELLEDAQGFGWENVQGDPNWEALIQRKVRDLRLPAMLLACTAVYLLAHWQR